MISNKTGVERHVHRHPIDAQLAGAFPGPLLPILGGISNHASGETGWICPGQTVLVRLDGGEEAAADANQWSIRFDGIDAPLRRRGPGQFTAVVPYGLRVSSEAAVGLAGGGGWCGEPLRVPVLAACPGLYTFNGQGVGQAVADNEDGGPNSAAHPARPGSVITLFGTGEGLTDPAPTDFAPAPEESWRLPRPVLPVKVMIGSLPAPLVFAGAIAGEAAGRFQMLVEVPDLGPGEHEVVVSAGGFSSRAGVTVQVGPAASYSPQ